MDQHAPPGARLPNFMIIGAHKGGTTFKVNGLPANLATSPITIAPNASYALSVTFSPSKEGLDRGLIQFFDQVSKAKDNNLMADDQHAPVGMVQADRIQKAA